MERKLKRSNFGKFLLLWSGELISSIGGGLTSFGLGVYVFQKTGSAAGMAVVTLLGFLPTLLLSVPAGVLADRYDRRLLMMLGDGCSALGILYILFCMINGGASLPQICIGVFVSSVCSSLLEPSYRATVTDLLTKEEYSKANGLVSLAGSARYLVSPLLAGFLLSVSDIKLLLVIDISTFVLTVLSTAVVKRGIETKQSEKEESFFQSMKEGWDAVHARPGIFLLILVSAVLTLFLGVFQILAEPLILALAGIFMVGFGIWENIFVICMFGFLFFMMLPFANNCLDYLVRTNIPDELQGRAWGFIGFLSQIGYVVAYGGGGLLADFTAKLLETNVGRGAGAVIICSGICLVVTAVAMSGIKSIQALTKMEGSL